MPNGNLFNSEDEIHQILKDLKNARCKIKTICCRSPSEEQLVLIDEQIRFERKFKREVDTYQTEMNVLQEKKTKYSNLMEDLPDEEHSVTRDLGKREIELRMNKIVDELVSVQMRRGGLIQQAREELEKRRETTVENECCSIL